MLIAGEGPLRADLDRRVAELGIGGSVRFLGRVSDEDLVSCYQAADVSVVPTVELEGFGLVVLESLACGTPVVATEIGGLPEILREPQPDLLVPPADPEALASRLTDAATERRPLPKPPACREYALGYGWDTAVREHLRIYADAAAGRRPRTPSRRERPARPTAPRERPARPNVRSQTPARPTMGRQTPARPLVVYLDHCALESGAELALARLLPALTRPAGRPRDPRRAGPAGAAAAVGRRLRRGAPMPERGTRAAPRPGPGHGGPRPRGGAHGRVLHAAARPAAGAAALTSYTRIP